MSGFRTDKNVIQPVYYNYRKDKSAKELGEMFPLQVRTVYNVVNIAEN